MSSYRETYPSTYASVAKARRSVQAFVEYCGFDAAETSDIVLSVGEACSNAVEHGHIDRGSFTVSCAYEDGLVRAEIADAGPGFDPDHPSTVEGRAAAEGRGRGIAIMRMLMDAVTYRVAEDGTTVVLEKRSAARSERGVGEARGEPLRVDAGRAR